MNRGHRSAALASLAAFAVTACTGGPAGAPGGQAVSTRAQRSTFGGSSNPITHVVIVVQENRSFDDLFATFPGADGATTGQNSLGQTVPLQPSNLVAKCDLGHSRQGYVRDYDGGKMDGFNLEGGSGSCAGKAGALPYQYVYPNQIAPYWDMASQYVLADHMFQTQGSGSFTAHQDLIAGATIFDQAKTESLVDFPSAAPWGCDAPPGTKTSYILPVGSKLEYKYHKGPFPCMTYETLRDLLDAQGVSWRYYSPSITTGSVNWNAFDAIEAVRDGPEWTTNISSPQTNVFNDISAGTLASLSWVVPDKIDSDHANATGDLGPSWVASIVNAIGQSQYWNSTAIIVLWDDWGGYYDHEPPPFIDNLGGLGFRVPMLVISPYARIGETGSGTGYISHTQYEFGSILKFVEVLWGLGSLGTTDARATSMVDCFDFTQAPRAFSAIPSQYSRAYFLHQRPSGQPVDDE